jgi:hypothetical protein
LTDLERIERKLDRILHLLGDAELVIQIITGIIALAIILFFLLSCSTCRLTAIQDAKSYPQYETRIAVYRVGLDGLIAGLGMWTHHAQAQVLVNGEWKWVSNGLQDEPEYTIDGEIYYWDVSIYEGYLRMMGRLE